MSRAALLALSIVGVLVLSAFGRIWVVHLNRTTFTELQRAYAARDEMNVQWGRLQIEQAAWSTHARIEQVASERLRMRIPEPAAIELVQP